MSLVNLLNSIQEGTVVHDKFRIGIQFNYKLINYSYLLAYLHNNNHIQLINFDINFYKYLQIAERQNEKKTYKASITHILTNQQLAIKELVHSLNKDKIIILNGVDLVLNHSVEVILRLLKSNNKIILYFVLEKTFKNLDNETIILNNNIVKNKLNYYLICAGKCESHNNDYYLFENFHFDLLSSSFIVIKYSLNKTNQVNPIANLVYIDISTYKKEHKALFEKQFDNEKDQIEPQSTFNLKKTEEEANKKKEVILPYMKEHNENLIKVDNDDLLELYEEDPDEDLDI